MTYRQIREAHGAGHGSIVSILQWADQNPELAEEEVNTVFGKETWEGEATPSELVDYWMGAVKKSLTIALELVDQVQNTDTAYIEETTTETLDPFGEVKERVVKTKKKSGPGANLFKVAGLLKILAYCKDAVKGLEGSGNRTSAPSVQVNVQQTVQSNEQKIANANVIDIEKISEAEDRLVSLSPEDRLKMLTFLNEDEEG